ncbi:MAG TPA: NUDIX hydrolase [Kineosporiaceae bacterium]|nr:NUDIX hydrolase [Kineosporiaceae bacterium]
MNDQLNQQLDDDLFAEGPPEVEFVPGIAATFASKRIAAAALIRDETGRFLLVEPTYKPTWLLPGGVVEANEDPMTACAREVQEELGLDLAVGPLLVVDWVPRHGVWGDSLQFIFDGGVLAGGQVTGLRLQESELRTAEFVTLEQASARTPPSLARRIEVAVAVADQGLPTYLRYGRPTSARN